MCFSAEMSMSVAAIASTVGYITYKSTKSKQFQPLALVPFLFALQQFSEGMIWLSYKFDIFNISLLDFFKGLFLTFAYLIWPAYLPFTIFSTEQNPLRKKLIGLLNFCGILLSIYFIYSAINNTIQFNIVNKSIQYSMKDPFSLNIWLLTGIYSFVILLPCFISSTKLIWSYGVFLALSWLTAEHFYRTNFTSVWCFFSAIISIYIYLIVKVNEKNYASNDQQ